MTETEQRSQAVAFPFGVDAAKGWLRWLNIQRPIHVEARVANDNFKYLVRAHTLEFGPTHSQPLYGGPVVGKPFRSILHEHPP